MGKKDSRTTLNKRIQRRKLEATHRVLTARCALQVCDQISSFVVFLQTGENHFRSGNIFLRIFQVDPQCVFGPNDALVLVSVTVGEAWNLTSLSSEKSMKIRSLFVSGAFFDNVALSTFGLEDFCTLLNITTIPIVRHFSKFFFNFESTFYGALFFARNSRKCKRITNKSSKFVTQEKQNEEVERTFCQ